MGGIGKRLKYIFAGLLFSAGGLILYLSLIVPAGSMEAASSVAGQPEVTVIELPPGSGVSVVEVPDTSISAIAAAKPGSTPRYSLQDLFVLDNLLSAGAFLDPDRTTIGDLLILDRIFNGGEF